MRSDRASSHTPESNKASLSVPQAISTESHEVCSPVPFTQYHIKFRVRPLRIWSGYSWPAERPALREKQVLFIRLEPTTTMHAGGEALKLGKLYANHP